MRYAGRRMKRFLFAALLASERRRGQIERLGGDRDHPGDFPNRIALSPDEKTLYVTAGFRKTLAYDVLPDDTVASPRVFIEAGNDGMKTDIKAACIRSTPSPRAKS